MTPMEKRQLDDPDVHKGAVESDRPSEETNVDDRPAGIDANGMPNDPVATAQDRVGAHNDNSEGG
jgi:hypothetical protein